MKTTFSTTIQNYNKLISGATIGSDYYKLLCSTKYNFIQTYGN